MKTKFKNRIYEIDLIRGVAVLLMVFDHFMYDLGYFLPSIFVDYPRSTGLSAHIFSIATTYWSSGIRIYFRYIIIFVFLALTGICCSFSRNNLKRGIDLLIVSTGVTLFSYIVSKAIHDPDMLITFGILHCIGVTLVIIGLLEKFKINKWVYFIVGLLCFIIGTYFETFSHGESLEGKNIFLMILKQMIGLSYSGGDCFPLIFNGGQIFIGVFLGKLFYSNKKSFFEMPYYNNPITFIGRNSLGFYLAHQIIIPIVVGIILLICGFSLGF